MKLSEYFVSLLEEEIKQSNIIKNFKIEISGAMDTEDEIKSNQELSSCNVDDITKTITNESELFFKEYKLEMPALFNIEWSYDSKYYKFVLSSSNGNEIKVSSASVGSKNIIGNISKIKNLEGFLSFVGGQEWMSLK